MPESSRWSKLLSTLQIHSNFSKAPAGLSWRSNTLFIVATVAIALFTDLFLYGLVVPVLPYMLQERVGLPEEQVQSYVSALLAAYAGASVVISPFAGLLADKLPSRQGPFLFGLFMLLIATVMLFLGTTIPVLVLARALQGVSAGCVWTLGLALCLETVGPDNLGKTIGSIFGFIGVGSFASPILGGLLYEKTGYTGVFAIAAAVLAVDLILRLLVIEKKVARKYIADDPSTVSDLNTTPAHQTDGSGEEGQQSNRTEAGEDDPLLGARKEDDEYYRLPANRSWIVTAVPILPCLRDPMLLTALLVAFVQAILFGSFDATIPTVARELFGFDSLKSGLLFIPLGVFDLILGPVFGWCVDRYGTKPVAVLSYVFLVPVLVLLRIPRPEGTDQVIIYGALLALCGIGMAGIGAPSIVEAGAIVQKYYAVNPELFGENGPYAQLYGLNNMVFSLGLTVGPELAGELKQRIGYGNMNIVLAAMSLVTALLSLVYIGGRPKTLMRQARKVVTRATA